MQRKCVIQDRNRDLYIVNVAPPLQAKGKEPEFRSKRLRLHPTL